jgi:NADH:ubiquinone oxidoreductase subunit
VTPKILSNIKNSAENPSDLDGYEELNPEDKEKVNKAWEEGKVAPEDIPESAKKPQGDDEEGDEEKKSKSKKDAAAAGEDKPKRARSSKKVGTSKLKAVLWLSSFAFDRKPQMQRRITRKKQKSQRKNLAPRHLTFRPENSVGS